MDKINKMVEEFWEEWGIPYIRIMKESFHTLEFPYPSDEMLFETEAKEKMRADLEAIISQQIRIDAEIAAENGDLDTATDIQGQVMAKDYGIIK